MLRCEMYSTCAVYSNITVIRSGMLSFAYCLFAEYCCICISLEVQNLFVQIFLNYSLLEYKVLCDN